MAKPELTVNIRIVPDDETIQLILRLLDLWQDSNPDQMIAMVPAGDRYIYEIINRRGSHGKTKSDGI